MLSSHLCVLVYKLQGFVPIVEEMAPQVINRKCAKHIYDNFKGKFGGINLRKYYWQASTAFTAYGFNKAMEKIRNASQPAYEYLMAIPLGHWSRHAFDPTPKIDHCTNNMSESFNAWIEPVRGFSILNTMEVQFKHSSSLFSILKHYCVLLVSFLMHCMLSS